MAELWRLQSEIPQNKTKKVQVILARYSSTWAKLAVMNLIPHRDAQAHGHDSLNVPSHSHAVWGILEKVILFKCKCFSYFGETHRKVQLAQQITDALVVQIYMDTKTDV